MKDRNLWPLLIIFIGISFAGITGWSVYMATRGVSAVTDPKYYSHGLKYNNTSIETNAAKSRGWVLTPDQTQNRKVVGFMLRDSNGDVVSGGQGHIVFSGKKPGEEGEKAVLKEDSAGRYTAKMPDALPDTVYAAISISKDGATIRRQLILNL